jgi:hypothetical protein
MGIRDDFEDYWDGNGLLCPNPVGKGVGQGSDNGTMFTSEYFIILQKLGIIIESEKEKWESLIRSCMLEPGLTIRAPNDISTDAPDNFYGILSAAKNLGNTAVPRDILWYGIKNFGFYNPENPGKLVGSDGNINWSSFQWRQFQMVAAMISASFPSLVNPLHFIVRIIALPLFFIAAISILISCINEPTDSTDPRRLSWHLIQTTSSTSLMCFLASLVWFKRLYKDYGQDGMRAVAKIYYQPKGVNPYSIWWRN